MSNHEIAIDTEIKIVTEEAPKEVYLCGHKINRPLTQQEIDDEADRAELRKQRVGHPTSWWG